MWLRPDGAAPRSPGGPCVWENAAVPLSRDPRVSGPVGPGTTPPSAAWTLWVALEKEEEYGT